MRWSKIPVQELWLKMGGGRIREGGRNSGILRYTQLGVTPPPPPPPPHPTLDEILMQPCYVVVHNMDIRSIKINVTLRLLHPTSFTSIMTALSTLIIYYNIMASYMYPVLASG